LPQTKIRRPIKSRYRWLRKKQNQESYANALRYYRAGTQAASRITSFLLQDLEKVDPASSWYKVSIGDHNGQLTLRTDVRGCVVFAFSAIGHGSNVEFVTAPNLWAWKCGHSGRLKPEEYRVWARSLEKAVEEELGEPLTEPKFYIPQLPDPASTEQEDTREWRRIEKALGKRLYKESRVLMFKAWRFFADRWQETTKRSSNGWPLPVKTSDGYLALQLGIDRYKARRALVNLDLAGIVQAAVYAKQDPKKRGIYCYIPGTGHPRRKGTRQLGITDVQTVRRYSAFVAANSVALQDKLVVLKEKKYQAELEQKIQEFEEWHNRRAESQNRT
jgi:hypothetical protein